MSVSCGCCQAEVSATGRSLIQRSPTKCACVSLSVIRSNNKFCNYNEQVVRGQDREWKEGRKKERKIISYKTSPKIRNQPEYLTYFEMAAQVKSS
jgi:hypothetical protein